MVAAAAAAAALTANILNNLEEEPPIVEDVDAEFESLFCNDGHFNRISSSPDLPNLIDNNQT